jgi:hypothetical protein
VKARDARSGARAVARYVGVRWLSKDAVLNEFLCRRGWYPEDVDAALTEALADGLLVEHPTDGAVKRPRPPRAEVPQ